MNFSRCENIKSRHYPNLQCKFKGVIGGFCKKHSKHPFPFMFPIVDENRVVLIQRCWRTYKKRVLFRRQGPAAASLNANNDVEIYSLDSLDSIPKIYFFSFADASKAIWAFDIRTLSYLCSKSKNVPNPYTREPLCVDILRRIKSRIQWLESHKYTTVYENASFSLEQMWNHKVLEVFNKMEEVGYIVNSDWFHDMSKEDHIDFYKKLYDIWYFRLGLTSKEKNAIVAGFNSARNKLFRYSSEEIERKDEKILKKNTLLIIEKLVSSCDKSQRGLGVMYVLMAFCSISDAVCEAYPWIAESI